MISPILSPVSAKLKSSVPAVSKPQEGTLDKHTLHERRYSSLEDSKFERVCCCTIITGTKPCCAAEIEARAEMESDKRLEKLETFLGRLNSKGELIDAKSLNFLVFVF